MPGTSQIPDLPLFISGLSSRGAHTLLFVHGWPDDESVFSFQTAHFAPSFRVATVRLPWFSTYENAESDAAERSYSREGYDLDVLAEAVARITRTLSDGGASRVTVIAHDWGAIIAQIADLVHPGLFHSMVLIDVALPKWTVAGADFSLTTMRFMLLLGFFYMWWVAAAFLVARVAPTVGTAMARRITHKLCRLGLWERPLYRARLVATGDAEAVYKGPARLGTHPISGYLYYYFTVAFVRGLLGLPLARGRKCVVPGGERLRRWTDTPTCPVLFMYGSDGFPLHHWEWERAVRERSDGSRVIEFSDSGHWVQIEKAEEVNGAIYDWINAVRTQ